MKNIALLYTIVAVAVVLNATACSHDEIELYDGPSSGIYFQQVESSDVDGNPLSFTDSVSFSFAGRTIDYVEHPLRIYVGTIGGTVDHARQYVLKYVAENSTAVEGVDFDLLKNDFTIQAGEARDTVIVNLHRTDRVRRNKLIMRFRLEPNEYFTAPLDSFKNTINWSSDAPLMPATSFTVSVSEVYDAPFNWRHFGIEYFGNFSVAKMQEIEKIMGWTYGDWQNAQSTKVAWGKFGFVANLLRERLQKFADQGSPVYDDDGLLMQLPGEYAVDYSAYLKQV